jgi:hypothetical protein
MGKPDSTEIVSIRDTLFYLIMLTQKIVNYYYENNTTITCRRCKENYSVSLTTVTRAAIQTFRRTFEN